MRLQTQAWSPHRNANIPPAERHFKSVETSSPRAKPGSGGMWTSTYHPEYGSAWVQFRLSEEFHCPENKTFRMWALEPDRLTRIYVIDSYADLADLCDSWGHSVTYNGGTLTSPLTYTFPNWTAIAEDYDAVHLTEAGQAITRLSRPLNLYGWDFESTLWLRWCFSRVTDLGAVRCRSVYEDEEVEAAA